MTLPLYPHGHRAAGPGGPATRKPRGLVAPEDVVELTLLPLETLTSLPWTLTPTEAGFFSGALRQYSAEMVCLNHLRPALTRSPLQHERVEQRCRLHQHISNDRRTPPFKHDAGGHALALRDNPATHGRVLGCARAIAGVREQQSWAARPDPVQALNTPLQSSDLWRGRMTKIAAFVTDTLYRACTGLCKAWHLDQKASAVRGN